MHGTRKAQAAWWISGNRRLALESLELDISGSPGGNLRVHATGTLRGRVSGLSPGDRDVQIELEVDGAGYRIANPVVFDVEFLPSGKSSVQVTGNLEPTRLPEKLDRGSLDDLGTG